MTKRQLLWLGGILNLGFGLFHIGLATQFSSFSPSPDVVALLHVFNVHSTVLLFFFAYLSVFRQTELLQSRLGQLVIIYIAGFWFLRAANEVIFMRADFSTAIFIACLAMGALYLPPLLNRPQSQSVEA